MARPRQAVAVKRQTAPASGRSAGRSPHTSQAATDLAQLLRSRAFCLSGEGAALARVAANLQATGGQLDEAAAAWIGVGAAPEGRVALSLGESAGALGPHSFGFLNNIDGIAALAAPLPGALNDRPRRGSIAWVVPRRDALPEVLPLLGGRGLGISWLISVGDGDPAEVLRFLGLDPATSGILLALGRGVRAQTLSEAIADKPVVLLEPPSLATRDSQLVRAVARRAGAVVTSHLEEWLAHAALLDAAAERGAARDSSLAGPARRWRAAVVVAGAGGDFVASEVQQVRAQSRALLSVRSVDSEEPAELEGALRQAAQDAQVVVLCGAQDLLSEVTAPGPLLRIDPAQPERLRALLRALAIPPLQRGDEKPLKTAADPERVETVLAGLPPPLYVGGAAVSDEVLGDHDLKRLLHAYGVRVSRQAPANTTTAALRILTKLSLPVELLPNAAPHSDVEVVAAAEAGGRVLCATQAEVKRQATLLLSRLPHVMLRESLPAASQLRVQASAERGIGMVLRAGRIEAGARAAQGWEAALLPLRLGEARQLADSLLAGGDAAPEPKALVELLAGISACLDEHALTLDLIVQLGKEPVVIHAAGVLKRQAAKKN